MREPEAAIWDAEFQRHEDLAAHGCSVCLDLRRDEQKTNTVKTDSKQEESAKKSARRAVHKKLAEHITACSRDHDDAHKFVTLRELLKPLLPDDAVLDDDMEQDDDDMEQKDDDVISAKQHDKRKVVCGRVPIHLRLKLQPPAADDIVVFSYSIDDDTTALGVALVLKVLPAPDMYHIQWYGSSNWETANHNPLTCSYFPAWVQNVKPVRGKLPTRTYYATKRKAAGHKAQVEDIKLDQWGLISYGKLTKASFLELKMKRLICAVPSVPLKLKGHDNNEACDCTHDI